MNPKVVVIGSITNDTIYTNGNVYKSLGGAPYFSSKVFESMNVAYGLVSYATKTLQKQFYGSKIIAKEGILECKEIPEVEINDDSGKITALVRNPPKEIRFADLPSGFLSSNAILISTLAGEEELSSATLEEMRKRFKGIMGLDLQGYTRPKEQIHGREFVSEEAKKRPEHLDLILRSVDVLKLNEYELNALGEKGDTKEQLMALSKYGPKVILLTLGGRGSMLLCNDKITKAVPDKKPVGHTVGAGDIFFALFIAKLAISDNPIESHEFANRELFKYIE